VKYINFYLVVTKLVVYLYNKIKQIEIMKNIAELIGMTEKEFSTFLLARVSTAMSFGFSEEEAKEIIFETLRNQLGLE